MSLQGDVDNNQDAAVFGVFHLLQLHVFCHQLWQQVVLLHHARPQHILAAHSMVGESFSFLPSFTCPVLQQL